MINLDKICRLCLRTDGLMSSIFQSSSSALFPVPNSIHYNIREFIDSEINPNDQLPKTVCSQCVHLLERSVKFRQLCKDSLRILQLQLESVSLKRELFEEDAETSQCIQIVSVKNEDSIDNIIDENIEPHANIQTTDPVTIGNNPVFSESTCNDRSLTCLENESHTVNFNESAGNSLSRKKITVPYSTDVLLVRLNSKMDECLRLLRDKSPTATIESVLETNSYKFPLTNGKEIEEFEANLTNATYKRKVIDYLVKRFFAPNLVNLQIVTKRVIEHLFTLEGLRHFTWSGRGQTKPAFSKLTHVLDVIYSVERINNSNQTREKSSLFLQQSIFRHLTQLVKRKLEKGISSDPKRVFELMDADNSDDANNTNFTNQSREKLDSDFENDLFTSMQVEGNEIQLSG